MALAPSASARRTRWASLCLAAALIPAIFLGGPSPASAADVVRPGLPSTKQIMDTVRDLVGFAPRATGTTGGEKTADYVAARFRKAGLKDVHFETARSYNWRASDSSLVVGGKKVSSFPIAHSFIDGPTKESKRSLGSNGKTAEIVDIGSGGVKGKDVKGKWVLFDLKFELPLAAMVPFTNFLWDPYLRIVNPEALFGANPYVTSQVSVVNAVQEAGALGVIGVLSDYFDSNKYSNEYYRRAPMTIPGVWVTKKDGATIRRLLAGNAKATMKLTATRKAVTAKTVVGFLPGKSKDTVMVQSHHDSQGPGAVEDGTGAAEVMALADYYGSLAKKPGYQKREKTLMFATFDSHFTGYQQHMAFADKYIVKKKTPYRIVADAAIEHIGKKAVIGKDDKLEVLDQHEPRGIFENLSVPLKVKLDAEIVQNNIHTTAVLNSTLPAKLLGGIPTDASFVVLNAIPTISLICGPLYMYDDADTLDKVDQTQLRPVAAFFADMLDILDRTASDRMAQGSLVGLGGKLG